MAFRATFIVDQLLEFPVEKGFVCHSPIFVGHIIINGSILLFYKVNESFI